MTSSDKKVKSIYQEALEMVAGALVIYVFADIRELARDGNAAPQFLSLDDLNAPLTAEQTLMIIQANQSKLEEMAINRKDVEDLLRAIMFIRAHQKKEGENANAGGIASTTTTNDQTSPASNIWNGGLTTLLSSFRKDMGTSSSSSFKLDLKSFKTPFKKSSSSQQQQQKNDDDNKTVVMTHFVDDKAKEEIVHAIVVNPDRERVTLIFRGSATPKDFIQDAKIAQIKVSNPVYDLLMKEKEKDDDDDNDNEKKKDMPDSINVHTGFYQYLFKVNKETKKTRLESILEDVKGELKKASTANNCCFQLYVTGHSLGGALSTLFGFYAAADDELIQLSPKGVVVYSIASPFVGNWKWRFAFQELERRKRLQHLRIQNAEDMVTLMPFAVPKAGFFSPIMAVKTGAGNLYKHVGMRLQLTKPSPNNNNNNDDTKHLPYNISYPVDQRMDDEEFAKDVQDVLTQGKSLMQAFKAVVTNNFSVVERYHSCTEYEERLESCKADLTNYTLDELYANKNIVADMMDPDYTPKNEGLMTTTFRALGLKKSGTSSSSGDMVESGSGKLVAPEE